MRRIRRNLVSGRHLRDRIRPLSVGSPIDITKMHGHMDIILTNIKTGKVEKIHEDNMMTNALQEYFRNGGFLNYPNIDQSNMVEELLGGVLGLDTALTENANIVRVPAGCKMTFNGSVGVLNNSAPTELGSYAADESGWQDDGSYVQTYDYSTSQANGTINCVCLTSKDYGYIGDGNSLSGVSHSTKRSIMRIEGTSGNYSGLSGYTFHWDLTDSSCYTFSIEEVEVEEETVKKGFIRKWRVPVSKLNIKGTKTTPIKLSEISINLDSDLKDAGFITAQPFDGKLLIWDAPSLSPSEQNYIWGSTFTQHLWTLTTSGSLTKSTVTNTTGNTDLQGLCTAYFDGNYCVFPKTYRDSSTSQHIDTRTLYVWNRTNNSMRTIENAYGADYGCGNTSYWYNNGFRIHHASGDGRLYNQCVSPFGTTPHIIDCVNEATYPTNAKNAEPIDLRFPTTPLMMVNSSGLSIYRDKAYIATINNLDNPVVKTSDKTMKVVYRITFDEQ